MVLMIFEVRGAHDNGVVDPDPVRNGYYLLIRSRSRNYCENNYLPLYELALRYKLLIPLLIIRFFLCPQGFKNICEKNNHDPEVGAG
jgi:hypothetical protein